MGGFQEGFVAVEREGSWGFVENTGRVVPPHYDDVSGFHQGLAKVKANLKCGYLNRSGIEIISLRFEDAGDFHEGLARVKIDDKWGYIDVKGKFVIGPRYGDAGDFS